MFNTKISVSIITYSIHMGGKVALAAGIRLTFNFAASLPVPIPLGGRVRSRGRERSSGPVKQILEYRKIKTYLILSE